MQKIDPSESITDQFQNLNVKQQAEEEEKNAAAAILLKTTPYTAAGAVPLYDGWVDTYDETLTSWGWTPPIRIAETLTEMGFGENTPVKVLDLGCGTGLSGEELKKAKIGSNGIVGIDISEKSIEHLHKAKAGLYSEAYAASIDEPIEFIKDNDFDVVTCSGAMSYFENFPVFYSEVLRVLKPGAIFCFSQNAANWDENIRGCKTEADKLVDAGKWTCKREGEPEAYTPDNPDPEWSARRIRIHVYEKRQS